MEHGGITPDQDLSILDDKVTASKVYGNYGVNGNLTSYGVDLEFPELVLRKTIKSREPELLQGKVEDTLRQWAIKYQRHLDKQHKVSRAESVDALNKEAQDSLNALKGLLHHTLSIDDTVDWDAIKRRDSFRIKPAALAGENASSGHIEFNNYGRPVDFKKIGRPKEPAISEFRKKKSLLSRLLFAKKIEAEFNRLHDEWETECKRVATRNQDRKRLLDELTARFDKLKCEFDADRERHNQALLDTKARYAQSDPGAIEEYCNLVLSASEYPDYFPQNWTLEYRPVSKVLVVEYELPSPQLLPTVEAYRYVQSRDEVNEKHRSETAQRALYDTALYQVCIRTIHELFEADSIQALDAVAFNGIVSSVNPATGVLETKTILSVSASRPEFVAFDLSKVDPKATFKHLKGVAATRLVDLAPIAPILQLEKTDKRIVEGRAVAANVDQSTNLAAMDWEDFEHLIRELFAKEFGASGEVHVTQVSSDGGVDAIAFDPDPIRGGKIVIQAKRYTNTVGVAAVRDLYGTVLNEGATKGILVTTADYGADSYQFAKDKPITLLNGNNLLSLLAKHGHAARINIHEARQQRA